ncbi:hypothetical protein [Nocardiopsis salina]|uniref:hypothetical protein n=1 Tax=Nocardiopsis salina TaxID=245836 RepID=UPI000381FCD6|nr:hypothetical protein [Nocardiopsis salina]
MEIRPAVADDAEGIEDMVSRRVQWLEERRVGVSLRAAAAMAEQAGDETPNWVLLDDGEIAGCTTTYTESPAWAFTEEERDIPAVFLASTWTVPNDRRLGWVLARWALGHAARTGHQEVRRGTFAPELVRYYTRVQGWTVLREVDRRGKVCTFLTRAAEVRPDLDSLLSGRITRA